MQLNMRKIPLTQGKFAIVDDKDFDELSKHKWYFDKYAIRTDYKNNRIYMMHRVIINTPKGMDTDHVNGNKLDNRRNNLRVSNRSQNVANNGLRKNNTIGFKGVEFLKNRNFNKPWHARLTLNYRCISLGCFSTAIEAAQAYNRAALKYFGEFARLNKI